MNSCLDLSDGKPQAWPYLQFEGRMKIPAVYPFIGCVPTRQQICFVLITKFKWIEGIDFSTTLPVKVMVFSNISKYVQ